MHMPWLQSSSPSPWVHWYTVCPFGQRDINKMDSSICKQTYLWFVIHPKTSHILMQKHVSILAFSRLDQGSLEEFSCSRKCKQQ